MSTVSLLSLSPLHTHTHIFVHVLKTAPTLIHTQFTCFWMEVNTLAIYINIFFERKIICLLMSLGCNGGEIIHVLISWFCCRSDVRGCITTTSACEHSGDHRKSEEEGGAESLQCTEVNAASKTSPSRGASALIARQQLPDISAVSPYPHKATTWRCRSLKGFQTVKFQTQARD